MLIALMTTLKVVRTLKVVKLHETIECRDKKTYILYFCFLTKKAAGCLELVRFSK